MLTRLKNGGSENSQGKANGVGLRTGYAEFDPASLAAARRGLANKLRRENKRISPASRASGQVQYVWDMV